MPIMQEPKPQRYGITRVFHPVSIDHLITEMVDMMADIYMVISDDPFMRDFIEINITVRPRKLKDDNED